MLSWTAVMCHSESNSYLQLWYTEPFIHTSIEIVFSLREVVVGKWHPAASLVLAVTAISSVLQSSTALGESAELGSIRACKSHGIAKEVLTHCLRLHWGSVCTAVKQGRTGPIGSLLLMVIHVLETINLTWIPVWIPCTRSYAEERVGLGFLSGFF